MNSHVAAYFLHLAGLYDQHFFDVPNSVSRSLAKSAREFAFAEMVRG